MPNLFKAFMALTFAFSQSITSLAATTSPVDEVSVLTESEILQATELTLKNIFKKTEESLEKHLFQEAHGRSCGMRHYRFEQYETTNNLNKEALNKFTVITEVYGPIYLCKGYEYFLCATQWSYEKQGWDVIKSSCESDHDWGYLLSPPSWY